MKALIMVMPLEHLKEAQLLRRIRSGDDSAFVETYDLFAPKIYRHILFRTDSPETAEDVMSETFLKAWEYVRTNSKDIQHLRAFLYRVANNLLVDFYRKRVRAAVPIDEDLERTLGDDPKHMPERVDMILQSDKLRQALTGLRPEVRELLVMRYLDDLSIDEIAEATGKNKNAVYVALHRGVKELKEVCSIAE